MEKEDKVSIFSATKKKKFTLSYLFIERLTLIKPYPLFYPKEPTDFF